MDGDVAVNVSWGGGIFFKHHDRISCPGSFFSFFFCLPEFWG